MSCGDNFNNKVASLRKMNNEYEEVLFYIEDDRLRKKIIIDVETANKNYIKSSQVVQKCS